MDETKLRIIAGAGAVFFGFAGITAFSVAGVIALQAVIGLTWAVISVACAMMALCLASVVVFLRPNKSAEEELDQFEDATADLLADLPFDTIASIVERRPMAAATMALAAGYMIVSHPDTAAKGLQKLVDELI